MDPALKVVVGLLVSLAASAVDAIGLNLQRRDHVRNASLHPLERRHECRRITWHIGFFLYIGSQLVGSSAALFFLQPSVVAALGSAALIFNFIFAYLLVGTKIKRIEIFATVFIIVGATLVAVFGDVPKDELKVDQLLALFRAPVFIGYFVVLSALSLLELFMTEGLARMMRAPALKARSKIPLLRTAKPAQMRRLLGLGYATAGGMIASMTVVLAETCVQLLSQTISGNNQFKSVAPFILVIVLVATAVTQVYCMNSGLKACDPVIVVPVFFAFYSTLALFNANVYYNQWYKYGVKNYVLMLLGIAIIIPGVYMISSGQESGEIASGNSSSDTLVDQERLPQGDQIDLDDEEDANFETVKVAVPDEELNIKS